MPSFFSSTTYLPFLTFLKVAPAHVRSKRRPGHHHNRETRLCRAPYLYLGLTLSVAGIDKRDPRDPRLGQSLERPHRQRIFPYSPLPDRMVVPDHFLLDDANRCFETLYVAQLG